MKSEVLIKIHNIIDSLNHKQQIIARDLLNNPLFEVTQISIYGKPKIVIKDIAKDEVYDFVDYVQSKCNCG